MEHRSFKKFWFDSQGFSDSDLTRVKLACVLTGFGVRIGPGLLVITVSICYIFFSGRNAFRKFNFIKLRPNIKEIKCTSKEYFATLIAYPDTKHNCS